MRSALGGDNQPGDLTARAAIRNTALRLFAERGPDAVSVREIASAAEVSPALVLHHYGSKDGLRAAVDEFATDAFERVLEGLGEGGLAEALADEGPAGRGAASIAEAFAVGFPPDSPFPAYLRRLLLAGDPAGDALFASWHQATLELMTVLEAQGLARPSVDPVARAAFLLVNDMAMLLLTRQVAAAIGVDPLSPAGMQRWGAQAADVYTHGAFRAPPEGESHDR
ncbi:MAG: TetR family transcriptional regulator [Ornithinibacter sp.]